VSTEPVCHYCKKPENFAVDNQSELRPYGPGGAWVCFRCAFDGEHPDRGKQAEAAFGALLDGAEAISTTGVVAIGDPTGPRPFDPREAACGGTHSTEATE